MNSEEKEKRAEANWAKLRGYGGGGGVPGYGYGGGGISVPFEVKFGLMIAVFVVGAFIVNCGEVGARCAKYARDTGQPSEVRGSIVWPTCYVKVGEDWVPK